MMIYQRKTATVTDARHPAAKVDAPERWKAITIAAPKQEKFAAVPVEQPPKIAQKQTVPPTVPLEAPVQGTATPIAVPKQEKVSVQPGEQQLKIAAPRQRFPESRSATNSWSRLIFIPRIKAGWNGNGSSTHLAEKCWWRFSIPTAGQESSPIRIMTRSLRAPARPGSR
jgi:hypothetical protein